MCSTIRICPNERTCLDRWDMLGSSFKTLGEIMMNESDTARSWTIMKVILAFPILQKLNIHLTYQTWRIYRARWSISYLLTLIEHGNFDTAVWNDQKVLDFFGHRHPTRIRMDQPASSAAQELPVDRKPARTAGQKKPLVLDNKWPWSHRVTGCLTRCMDKFPAHR